MISLNFLYVFFNAAGKRARRFFSRHGPVKALGIIAALFVLSELTGRLPSLWLQKSPLPELPPGEKRVSLGEIQKDAGPVVAAESGGRKLYVDPLTANIRVADESSGLEWNALRLDSDIAADRCLLRLEFSGRNGDVIQWDSYSFAQKAGTFTVEKIPRGARITLHIVRSDPQDISEIIPRRIAVERFNDAFTRAIAQKTAEGVFTESEASRFEASLDMVFGLDAVHGYYYTKMDSMPPGSVTQALLQMTRGIGYTAEHAAQDESPWAGELGTIVRSPVAGFYIPIDFVLDGEDLLAEIATGDIVNENSYYTLVKVSFLPNFGAVTAEERPGGYMFVPDGSGALVAMNSFNENYNGYERPLYNNNEFSTLETLPGFAEMVTLPVFGMTYEGAGSGKAGGFMGIIEAGDETAAIAVRTAQADLGAGGFRYNQVYPSFSTAQYTYLNISGGGGYIAGTGPLDMVCAVRYKLFDTPAGYFDMAMIYKNYLTAKYGLELAYPASPRIYLDVTGSVPVEDRLAGFAIYRMVPMTTYSELAAMLRDLEGIPVTAAYSGVFDRGTDNRLPSRAAPVPGNGTGKELDALLDLAHRAPGTELFFGTNLGRVYYDMARKTWDDFWRGYDDRTHAAMGFDGEPAVFAGYYRSDRRSHPLTTVRYTRINPRYLSSVVQAFLSHAGRYENIYVNDLGADYYAGYRRDAVVAPLAGRMLVAEELKRLSSQKKLALNNPVMERFVYASWAVNISRESSNYGAFFTSVPFRQLLLNGLCSYTTLNVNESGESPDYYLLQALETGSVPKFSVTAKNSDTLKYSTHKEFLSTAYAVWAGEIKALYRRWKDEADRIGSGEIVNHEILGDKVFKTTYSGGAELMVNYNHFPVEIDGVTLQALGYHIRRP
ncbi:MAG: DUF5696 domain-containing protein [Treponema sp.]|jgi:hypothetical protein|nr:DUF5696 domain-containing protein [Treponema sp.]